MEFKWIWRKETRPPRQGDTPNPSPQQKRFTKGQSRRKTTGHEDDQLQRELRKNHLSFLDAQRPFPPLMVTSSWFSFGGPLFLSLHLPLSFRSTDPFPSLCMWPVNQSSQPEWHIPNPGTGLELSVWPKLSQLKPMSISRHAYWSHCEQGILFLLGLLREQTICLELWVSVYLLLGGIHLRTRPAKRSKELRGREWTGSRDTIRALDSVYQKVSYQTHLWTFLVVQLLDVNFKLIP